MMNFHPPPGQPPLGRCKHERCGKPWPQVWLPLREKWIDTWCDACQRAVDEADARPQLRDRLRKAGLKEEVLYDLERVSLRPEQRQVASWTPTPGGCLLVPGGVGTGKTIAVGAFCKAQVQDGRNALYANWRVLKNHLQGGMSDRDAPEAQQARQTFRRIQTVPWVVVLDDVGKVDVPKGGLSDYDRDQLFVVVETRKSERLPLVILTNITDLSNELGEAFGQPVASRLFEMIDRNGGLIVPFLGPDRRVTGGSC